MDALIHFMIEEAQDLEYQGVTALCDYDAGLTESPRHYTLTSTIRSEVTCPDCLALLA